MLLKTEGKIKKIDFGACPDVYSIRFYWPFALYRAKNVFINVGSFFACGVMAMLL